VLSYQLFFERALGLVETVVFKELGPVDAKVDSGNGAFNVLHGTDVQEYGDMINFKTVGGKGLTKRVKDYIDINIGAGKVEKRPVVTFDIEFGGKLWKNIPFSISDRGTNEQPVLIGKDFIVKNGGVIDVTKEYNLGTNTTSV
jgi:hypothetical protein